MQRVDGRLVYSATDLVGYLQCRHLAKLERAAAWRHIERPMRSDPVLDRIQQRGLEHEQRFLDALRGEGLRVVEVERDDDLPREARRIRGRDETLAAMREGADVIFQAVLFDGRRLGYADFLRRVDAPSGLGSWSYEVWDTKLARHATASAVLQLCLYSDMVAALQGAQPQEMHLALGGVQRETVSFRVADYAAYYRLVAREFEGFLDETGRLPGGGHAGTGRALRRLPLERAVPHAVARGGRPISRRRLVVPSAARPARDRCDDPHGPGRARAATAGAPRRRRSRGPRADPGAGEHSGPGRAPQASDLRAHPAHARPRGRVGAQPGAADAPCKPSPGDLFFDIEGDPFFESDEVDGIDYLFGVIEPGRRGRERPAEPSTPSGRSRTAPSRRARSGAPSKRSSTWSAPASSPTRPCTSTTTRPTNRPR